MVFDTHLWNDKKITCPEKHSNPRLLVPSRAWYPLHHRVNHAGCVYLATYWCLEIERRQSTGHFSFETFVCIMGKSQIKFGLRGRQKFSRAKKTLQTPKERLNNDKHKCLREKNILWIDFVLSQHVNKLPRTLRDWPDGAVVDLLLKLINNSSS